MKAYILHKSYQKGNQKQITTITLKNLKIMDFMIVCRCCLTQDIRMKNINSTVTVDDEKKTISSLLSQFFGDKVYHNDNTPTNVCVLCIRQLIMFHSFKMITEKATAVLESQYSHMAKEEIKDFTRVIIKNSNSKCDANVVESESEMQSLPEANDLAYSDDENNDVSGINEERVSQSDDVNEGQLFCTSCDLQFIRPEDLHKHSSKEHPVAYEQGRPCDYCNKRLPDISSLVVHRLKHFFKHVCPWCWRGFKISTEFSLHIQNCTDYFSEPSKPVSTEDKVLYPCQHCGKSYPKGYLSVHLKIHGARKYKCEYCDQTFKQRTGLNNHLNFLHKDPKTVNCPHCCSIFKSEGTKQKHIRRVHNKERNSSCPLCGKGFFGANCLKNHMLTHTGVKKFTCQLCGKAYQTKFGLKTHISTRHETQNVKVGFVKEKRDTELHSAL